MNRHRLVPVGKFTRGGRGIVAACITFAGTLLLPGSSHALPPGRAWAVTERLHHSTYGTMSAGLLEVDGGGTPQLVSPILWDGGDPRVAAVWTVLTWKDSAWVDPLPGGGRVTAFPEPVLSLTSRRFLAWLSGDPPPVPSGYGYVQLAELYPDHLALPDTAIMTVVQSGEYSAAASRIRRWAARSHQPVRDVLHTVVAYSDSAHIWRELPRVGFAADHCTIAPLGDSAAILVTSGERGLEWDIVRGSTWAEHGNLDSRPLGSKHPMFRFRRSGGLWLIWTDREVQISFYKDGVWSRTDSIVGTHPEGETFVPAWNDASRDTAERPVLVWGDLGYGFTFRDVGSIAFPTETGWTAGEEIPGSEGMFLSPVVTRDRNGDAWVAWNMKRRPDSYFTHTYVSATTSTPTLDGAGRHRTLHWTLSEPAPESWWTVLRSRRGGEYEEVARVRAGNETAMSWTDDSPPAGHLRYRLRRESVDTRYLWESGEAYWPIDLRKPLRFAMPAPIRPEGGREQALRLELEGAEAGPLDVALYDLQGRLVLRQRPVAEGNGMETIRLDLGAALRPITAGIYFVLAEDAGGRRSEAMKVVVLR